MHPDQFTIVVSLFKVESLDLVLPQAFICNVDKHNNPAYIQGMALKTNAASYIEDYQGSMYEEMVNICDELSMESLESVYNRNKKKPEKLNVLFADEKIKKHIQFQITKKLSSLLQIVQSNHAYICWDLQRKIKASDILLSCLEVEAVPLLTFTKTQTGIRYLLKLNIGNEVVIPAQHHMELIADKPGIILLDRYIVKLQFLNGAKLKPFLKNESVFIPEKMVLEYFSKFVVDVMGQVDVESEGFDIEKVIQLKKPSLSLVYDLISDKYFLDIRYKYVGFEFLGSDVSKRKTKLLFDDKNQIKVIECIRQGDEENKYAQILMNAGFSVHHNNRFFGGEHKYATLELLNDVSSYLLEHFDMEYIEVEGKVLNISTINISVNYSLNFDWFDISGIVMIGDEQLTIRQLFKNIKDDNPFLKLADGSYVLIPSEIMTKYSQLVQFATMKGEDIKLAKSHFTIIESLEGKPISLSENQKIDEVVYQPTSKLKANLRPYQLQGVEWLIKHRMNGLGACLADDMGLGKTLQTIAALLHAKESKPAPMDAKQVIQLDLFGEVQNLGRIALSALIILPASLVFNWANELRKYAPSLQVLHYTGAGRKKVEKTMSSFDVVLTTYQTVVSDVEFLKTHHFHYIILDESQQIRNKNSKTFLSIHQLSCDHRISLSGTPIENSLSDLWSQMEFINPSILGTYSFFKETFQIPIEKNANEKALAELKSLVDPYILRRTKFQVAKDLPELSETIYYTSMTESQRKAYEREKSAARNQLLGLDKNSGQYRFHVLSSLMKLRQIANHPKIAYEPYSDDSGKFEDVKDQLLTIVKSGMKVLVFSSFLSHLKLFVTWLTEQNIQYVQLDGAMDGVERQRSVTTFQDDKDTQVFLLSIKAGGTGLNLTAADYVFILDPWWNPFVEMQAIARAHRIGREKQVMVTRFISKDTIEEKIMMLQAKKKTLSADVIDISDIPELSTTELEGLLDD